MNHQLIPSTFAADPHTTTVFRLVRRGIRSTVARPMGLTEEGEIRSENFKKPALLKFARYHLPWSHLPTPFISVFNNYRRALAWAYMLEQAGFFNIDIVVIDASSLCPGRLFDATKIATHLGFTQRQISLHENEYLWHSVVESERILAILPAQGDRVCIPIPLGYMTVPQALVDAIGSEEEEAIRTWVDNEVFQLCGTWDCVRQEQTLLALCTTRSDEMAFAA